MMMLIAGIIGGLGLACLISRQTMLGLLVGMQLLVLGATMIFVVAGISSGVRTEGHLFGFFVLLSGIAQLVGGYAIAIRLFYLKKRVRVDDLRSLKQ